jgi:GNAT superfamily N-acetyltransferase
MPIRLAQPTDGPGISRLLTQLGYPGTERFMKSRLAAMLADPAETLLVWVEDNHILGLLSLHFIPQIALEGDFARISYFAVDDSARSLGIGRQLEEEATRLAREKGCDRLEVHCNTDRTRAHEFYARQGYHESPKYLIKKLK